MTLQAHLNRPLHRIEKELVLEGLLQEVERAVLHRLYGQLHIPVAGHEDHGKQRSDSQQAPLQLQPAQPRHADVEDDAAARNGEDRRGGEEGFAGFVPRRLPAHRFEQEQQGAAERGFVIHHVDHGRVRGGSHELSRAELAPRQPGAA